MSLKKINVALVGLGFGGAFAEIYKEHPMVGELAVFDTDKALEKTFREKLGIKKEYASLEDILKDPAIDAVHLVTPIPLHEEQSVAVLEAGKHCACTVPMATSLEGIRKITEAKRKSGKTYMMMETTLYTYQFFYVKQLLESGELGKIQFLRGSHYQDMANWPEYWLGLPPMHYGTHAIAPMRVLGGSRLNRVVCFGSGTMDKSLTERYGNPYPVESALFSFENGLKAEATRSLFETARAYQEGLFVYGSKKSFEWGFEDGDAPYVTELIPNPRGERGGITNVKQITLPNPYQGLPEEIQRFTVGGNYDPLNPQKTLETGAGGGHHGSHPHLVHEFLMSIAENRKPAVDEELGGNITAAGVCAHLSAMEGGASMEIPQF